MDFQRDILEMIQIVKGSIVTTTADIIQEHITTQADALLAIFAKVLSVLTVVAK